MTHRSPLVLLAGAGLSWLLGQAVLPDRGLATAERYDAVAASLTAQAWSTTMLVVAGCLLVLGALATAHATAPLAGAGARLVRVGTALTALGGIWLVAGRASFNLVFLRVIDDRVPREAALSVLDDSGGPAFVPLVLTLPCLLLGPVLLALGLRRAGLAGRLPILVWVAGMATFLATEFTVKLGEVVGIGLAAAALVLIGLAAARAPQGRAGESPLGADLAVPGLGDVGQGPAHR